MIPFKRNLLELRIISLPRSGHHGVIGWLFGHYSGEILHYNDVVVREHENNEKAHLFLNTNEADVRDLYVFNVENRDLEWAVNGIKTDRWKTHKGPSDVVRYMLVLRDPYNCFASFIKMFGYDAFFSQGIASRWKQYAREFLGVTHILPKDTLKVSFTDWFLSKGYRRLTAESLGLKFSDDKFRTPYGPDSAFETGIIDASKRKVLDRWQSFSDDPVYSDIFVSDTEIGSLSEAVFGDFVSSIQKTLRVHS